MTTQDLVAKLKTHFSDLSESITAVTNEVTLEVPKDRLLTICQSLRDHADFAFSQVMDICGVDYLDYGVSEWSTGSASEEGFDRARQTTERTWQQSRYAVVYHLLSQHHNCRLRLKVFLEGEPPVIDSVCSIWSSANWFEREAFDLFGIFFEGHPDLRRILTDYGFIGHPFRKDFPQSGEVEVRYDAALERVIYEPVEIAPRVLVPKIIRKQKESDSHA